jgi:dUTP pyrophosphatase
MNNKVIDRKFVFAAVNPVNGKKYDQTNAVVFCAKDKALLPALQAYSKACYEMGANKEHLDSVNLLIERVSQFQLYVDCRVPDTVGREIDRCVHGNLDDDGMQIRYIGPYPLKQAKPGDAGYDICTNETRTVPPFSSAAFSTGLRVAIPPGYVGKVVSRSGLSFKHNIEVGAGVIDSGYRGEIRINLHNHGNGPVTFNAGDRIAQLLILKHESPEFNLVEELDETERGENGFGHTGVKSPNEHMAKTMSYFQM